LLNSAQSAKVFIGISLVLCLGIGYLCAADAEVVKTTMCSLWESPGEYAGKMVEVRANVIATDMSYLWIDFQGCPLEVGYMHLLAALPERVQPRPDFELEENSSAVELREALGRHVAIIATFEGRFEPVFVWRNQQRIRVGEGEGFGRRQDYDGRIIVRRISEVETLPIPYR